MISKKHLDDIKNSLKIGDFCLYKNSANIFNSDRVYGRVVAKNSYNFTVEYFKSDKFGNSLNGKHVRNSFQYVDLILGEVKLVYPEQEKNPENEPMSCEQELSSLKCA